MKIAIVTGGHIEYGFVREELDKNHFDAIIACDSGCRFFLDTGLSFDYAVGDFDSLEKAQYDRLMNQFKDKVTKYPSEKDYTDTEIGVRLAMDLIGEHANAYYDSEIVIYGATGNRIDHVLGNIELLYEPTIRGVRIAMIDEHNRVELIKNERVIERKEGYPFFSIVPYNSEEVTVTETGAKYELKSHVLKKGVTLGVSNEIKGESARVTVTDGELILVLARD